MWLLHPVPLVDVPGVAALGRPAGGRPHEPLSEGDVLRVVEGRVTRELCRQNHAHLDDSVTSLRLVEAGRRDLEGAIIDRVRPAAPVGPGEAILRTGTLLRRPAPHGYGDIDGGGGVDQTREAGHELVVPG